MDDLKVIQERWERHQQSKEKENKDFGKMEDKLRPHSKNGFYLISKE